MGNKGTALTVGIISAIGLIWLNLYEKEYGSAELDDVSIRLKNYPDGTKSWQWQIGEVSSVDSRGIAGSLSELANPDNPIPIEFTKFPGFVWSIILNLPDGALWAIQGYDPELDGLSSVNWNWDVPYEYHELPSKGTYEYDCQTRTLIKVG